MFDTIALFAVLSLRQRIELIWFFVCLALWVETFYVNFDLVSNKTI